MPTPISTNLQENIDNFNRTFSDCADIKQRSMKLGQDSSVGCFIAYVEVALGNILLEDSVIGKLLNTLWEMPEDKILSFLRENALGISDTTEFATMEEAAQGMLTGDALFFFEGYDRAIKIKDKGYPNMGVTQTETEKVVRGSNEGFAESIKINTALIRKRLRTPKVKVRESFAGTRSHTNVDLVYMEDLIQPELLMEIENRLKRFEIDGVLDSGIIEQLTEENWRSPFPQFQTTQRPDRAAMAILEGRVVLLTDNSPVALILPVNYHSFIQTSDDYYSRSQIASMSRLLRYAASFFAMALPGLYLALINFHTRILPTDLLLSFAAARSGVPFPSVVEVLFMELAFELLREAGVRLPGTMGNTIGIVGGLIVGQAAVEANLVSPIVVIVVALTALCSFAVPNEEFAAAFRILKFFLILMCASLGFFGFLLASFAVLIHLAGLYSFGIPYLAPYIGPNPKEDEKDALLRLSLRKITKRPVFAKKDARKKLKWKE
ncbi:spore germination protein [Clostridia bacterium]|nr:spore germination protein [Clostridia bacterium]